VGEAAMHFDLYSGSRRFEFCPNNRLSWSFS